MANFPLPVKNTAYILYIGLIQQADTKLLKASATIATGDFKVSIDGAAFANLATLPAVTPAAGTAVKVSLSAAEMNGDNIVVTCIDAAGAEWCDQLINIQTATRGIDDLAFPTVSGRSLDISGGGEAGIDWANVGTPGSTVGLTATTVATVTTTTTATNLTNAATSGDLTATMKTSVNTEVVDGLNVDTYAEPAQGTPAATATLAAKLNYLYKAWRNKKTQTSTTFNLFNDDAATVDHKSTVSDDGTTATVGEIATGP